MVPYLINYSFLVNRLEQISLGSSDTNKIVKCLVYVEQKIC